MALTLAGGAAALALTGTDFDAGDGNLVVDPSERDWATFNGNKVDCDSTPKVGCGIDKPTGQTDDSFGQGTKEDTEVPSVVDGSIPNNKSDLTRFYVANEKLSGDDFLYLAWERVQEPTGTTNMDFEFNQKQCTPDQTPADTDCSSNGLTPKRTAYDVLIKYDLAQGGTHPTLGYHFWVTQASATADPDIPNTAGAACEASNSFPCWGDVKDLTGFFEGSINDATNNPTTGEVEDPIDPDAPRTLSARTFGEAAINLTDSGILPGGGSCEGFGSAYLKSRSSDAFTSAVKDFIAPLPVNITNCGKIIIKKVTDPSSDTTTSFPFTLTAGPSNLNQSFSLVGGGEHDSGQVQAGSGYVAAETTPSGWTLTSATCDDSSPVTNIDVSVGETVTCTFTNTAKAKITIIKVSVPEGASDFPYTTSGTGLSDFTLDDNGDSGDGTSDTKVFSDLTSFGDKGVTEAAVVGFDLTLIACSGDSGVKIGTDSDFDAGDTGVTIDLDPGEDVTCTFTNTQRGSINIVKKDDAGNLLGGAVFTLYVDDPGTTNAEKGSAQGGGTQADQSDDAQDIAVSPAKTCTTASSGVDLGKCSITDVVPGYYWVVETTGVPGYGLAPDQSVQVTAGTATTAVDFIDPKLFKVIVIVCEKSNTSLYSAKVSFDGAAVPGSANSPTDGALGAGIDESALCGLSGTFVHDDVTRAGNDHSSTIRIP
jgi:hypothetical protein